MSAGASPSASGRPGSAAKGVSRQPFGTLDDGTAIDRIVLADGHGFEAAIIAFGAAIQSLFVPDRHGVGGDVVLGYPDLASYARQPKYFGATIGRYANRIAKGRFTLDGTTYQLPVNNGPNTLHGGPGGFDRRVWTLEETDEAPHPFVRLARTSADGEEGFPGRLEASVTFSVPEKGTLRIDYEARSDRPTIVAMTNHSFFNLAGAERLRDVFAHRLTVAAEAFLPVDQTAIPTGEIRAVAGTPFDFREAREVGARIHDGSDDQLVKGRGYDHNFVLDGLTGEPTFAARIAEESSGRVMELWTTEPGLQVYSGNFLDATVVGKHGQVYRQGDALCLEPQHFPDSPNRPEFPSVRLDPGGVYRQTSLYRFSAA